VGEEKRTIATLAGSASIKANMLTISVTNLHARLPVEVTIDLGGIPARDGQLVTLTDADLHAYNTFERPSVLVPVRFAVALNSDLRITLPPASVSALRLKLS
jgi:alpha-L-arabinofuranosidase